MATTLSVRGVRPSGCGDLTRWIERVYLHGEPVVCSPEDAIHTVDGSGLRYLALGSFLLKKRQALT